MKQITIIAFLLLIYSSFAVWFGGLHYKSSDCTGDWVFGSALSTTKCYFNPNTNKFDRKIILGADQYFYNLQYPEDQCQGEPTSTRTPFQVDKCQSNIKWVRFKSISEAKVFFSVFASNAACKNLAGHVFHPRDRCITVERPEGADPFKLMGNDVLQPPGSFRFACVGRNDKYVKLEHFSDKECKISSKVKKFEVVKCIKHESGPLMKASCRFFPK